MTGKGAQEGNKNARKSEEERERGVSLSLYIDAYECAFIAHDLQEHGTEPTPDAIRKEARRLLKDALNTYMRQFFLRSRQWIPPS